MEAAIALFWSSLQAQLDGGRRRRFRCLHYNQQEVNMRSRKVRSSSRFAQDLAERRRPEIDQSELLRYLPEMTWFPTAWLSDYIQFPTRVEVTWHLESEAFSYFRGEITGIECNQSGKAMRFLARKDHNFASL
jgi:hypothetical protein